MSQAGTCIGEVGALLGGLRSASVKAETEARVIWVPAGKVEAFLQSSKGLPLKLARALAEHLRDATGNLAAVQIENAHLTALLNHGATEFQAMQVTLDRHPTSTPTSAIASQLKKLRRPLRLVLPLGAQEPELPVLAGEGESAGGSRASGCPEPTRSRWFEV